MSPAPPLRRLKTRPEFLFVRAGVKAVRTNVLVEARKRPAGETIGIGLTATRKIGNAVVRNRARRRLREAARQLLPVYGAPGVDYVLVARAPTAQAPWARLLDDLRSALISVRADLEGGRPQRMRGGAGPSARKPPGDPNGGAGAD